MPLHPYQFIPRTFSSPLTLRTGSSLTLDDNVTLGLGTSDGESTVKSDGADTIWQMVSGGLTIGLAASAPSPDNNVLHIWNGSAGVVTANANTMVVFEAVRPLVQFLSTTTEVAGFYFGDPTLAVAGQFLYSNNLDRFQFAIAGTDRLYYSAAAFAFQEATTISGPAASIATGTRTGLTFDNGDLTITGASTSFLQHRFLKADVTATSAQTIDSAATVYIDDAPDDIGAGPATITDKYALWVDAGRARIDGAVVGATGAGFILSSAAMAFQEATAISVTTGILAFDGAAGSAIRFNEASADVDFIVETDGKNPFLAIDAGLNAMGINAAAASGVLVSIAGTWTAPGTGPTVLYVDTTMTASAGATTMYGVGFAAQHLTQTAEENITDIETVWIYEPRIVKNLTGAGAIARSQLLLIEGVATEATDNFALRVTTGVSAFGITTRQNVTANGAILAAGGLAFTDVANAWIDDATHGTGTVVHYIGNNTIDTTAPSDVRLKDNIGPLNALDVLRRLPVIEFESKYWGPGRHGGFDAQAAGRVLPNLAVQDTQGYWRFQGHLLMPYVVGGIQDIVERVEALEKENHELRALVAGRGS